MPILAAASKRLIGLRQIARFSHHASSKIKVENHTRDLSSPSIVAPATAIIDKLLEHTSTLTSPNSSNVVAFSGGIDSSLASLLVFRTSADSTAILGVGPAVPPSQIRLAREIAEDIGIPYREIETAEGSDPTYLKNAGMACFACKTHLYTALRAVKHASSADAFLFNGTNKDDLKDETRVGLIAAEDFEVRSPLRIVTKDEIRVAARHLGLKNWNYAASPCLRSRLSLGVEATEDHLIAIDKAEERVRNFLGADPRIDLRVRLLAGKMAMVELDPTFMEERAKLLRDVDFTHLFQDLGFDSVGVRPFKTGSVARNPIK